MGLRIYASHLSLFLLLLLAVSKHVRGTQVFDVTKFGARADGKTDISKAISDAWKQACAFKGPSRVLIPKGRFMSNVVTMQGPCSSSIEFVLQGNLLAPANPSSMKGDTWLKFLHVDKLTVFGGGTLDGQGQTAWKQTDCGKNWHCKPNPMNVRFDFVSNAFIHDITSLNSKYFHVNLLGCNNVTFQHFTIQAPSDSKNTDGIHIGKSKSVKILDSKIATGDDCISIGDGTQQLTVTKVTCGPGHGISVGSLGRYKNEEPVSGIFVKDCTFIGTDNGVRIKTWPNMTPNIASDMHFENINMQNVMNPILIDQEYCPWNQCDKKAPSKVKISKISFKNIKGTSATPLAVNLACSKGLPCEKVELANIDLAYSGKQGPAKSACLNVKPVITGTLRPTGC